MLNRLANFTWLRLVHELIMRSIYSDAEYSKLESTFTDHPGHNSNRSGIERRLRNSLRSHAENLSSIYSKLEEGLSPQNACKAAEVLTRLILNGTLNVMQN